MQGLLPVLRRRRRQGATVQLGRFVVNVTSQEGVFSTDGAAAKSAEHPHSNMAKAALNMFTKTSAPELASIGIFCTAVDPGWVSMMRPGDHSNLARPLPPLTEIDGAARVVAPVFDGVRALRQQPQQRVPLHGVLLRNFEVAPW